MATSMQHLDASQLNPLQIPVTNPDNGRAQTTNARLRRAFEGPNINTEEHKNKQVAAATAAAAAGDGDISPRVMEQISRSNDYRRTSMSPRVMEQISRSKAFFSEDPAPEHEEGKGDSSACSSASATRTAFGGAFGVSNSGSSANSTTAAHNSSSGGGSGSTSAACSLPSGGMSPTGGSHNRVFWTASAPASPAQAGPGRGLSSKRKTFRPSSARSPSTLPGPGSKGALSRRRQSNAAPSESSRSSSHRAVPKRRGSGSSCTLSIVSSSGADSAVSSSCSSGTCNVHIFRSRSASASLPSTSILTDEPTFAVAGSKVRALTKSTSAEGYIPGDNFSTADAPKDDVHGIARHYQRPPTRKVDPYASHLNAPRIRQAHSLGETESKSGDRYASEVGHQRDRRRRRRHDHHRHHRRNSLHDTSSSKPPQLARSVSCDAQTASEIIHSATSSLSPLSRLEAERAHLDGWGGSGTHAATTEQARPQARGKPLQQSLHLELPPDDRVTDFDLSEPTGTFHDFDTASSSSSLVDSGELGSCTDDDTLALNVSMGTASSNTDTSSKYARQNRGSSNNIIVSESVPSSPEHSGHRRRMSAPMGVETRGESTATSRAMRGAPANASSPAGPRLGESVDGASLFSSPGLKHDFESLFAPSSAPSDASMSLVR